MIGTATATMPMERDTDTALSEKPQALGACPTLTPGPPCQEPPTRV